MPDSSPSKTFPLRPTIPVVAMMLGICGATAVFAAILWQFLEHRAQHRFASESKTVATGLEKRVADAMEDLRRLQAAAPRSLAEAATQDTRGLERIWRESRAPSPSLVLIGIRSNSLPLGMPTPQLTVGNDSGLRQLVTKTTFPVAHRIQLPGWETNLPNCECLAMGADLLRPRGARQIPLEILQGTIGSGAVGVIDAMRVSPHATTNSIHDSADDNVFLTIMAAIYSRESGSMHGNPYARFPNTEGLISAVYSVESLFRGPLDAWSRDFHIKLQYGEAEHGEFRDWGPPVVLGAFADTPQRFHASYDVDLAGIHGRIHLEPTSHWLRSTGTWTAWALLGFGVAGALWLAAWMTRQIELSRNREFETMELRAANTALAVVREVREQITRELHDNTLQNLYALGLELKRGRERLSASPEETRDCLDRGLEEVRHISHELRQFLTQSTGERVALGAFEVFNSILERFRRGSGADIQMQLNPDAVLQISAHATAELAQILREAISNALRHGNATRIDIRLTPHGSDGWEFSIQDNGSGFDPAAPRTGGGLGLGHMDTRAARLGATFTLDARPGEGCQITLTQPGSPVPIPSAIPT